MLVRSYPEGSLRSNLAVPDSCTVPCCLGAEISSILADDPDRRTRSSSANRRGCRPPGSVTARQLLRGRISRKLDCMGKCCPKGGQTRFEDMKRIRSTAGCTIVACGVAAFAGVPEVPYLIFGDILRSGQSVVSTEDVSIVARVDVDLPPTGNFPGPEDRVGQIVGLYTITERSALRWRG